MGRMGAGRFMSRPVTQEAGERRVHTFEADGGRKTLTRQGKGRFQGRLMGRSCLRKVNQLAGMFVNGRALPNVVRLSPHIPKKLSHTHGRAILQVGDLSECLYYLEFLKLQVQRDALAMAAKCCQEIQASEFHLFAEALPIFAQRLSQSDTESTESQLLYFMHLTNNFKFNQVLLEKVLCPELWSGTDLGLITHSLTNMNPTAAAVLLLGFTIFSLGSWAQDDPPDDDDDGNEFVHRPRVKPGECPADVDSPICKVKLFPKCRWDFRCPDKAKCCFSGCRKRCRLPLEDKNNMCPYFDASKCLLKSSTLDECSSDQQCQGSERCCCFNCRRECTRTITVKTGQCPAVTTKCPAETPQPECKTDDNCKGSAKCCEFCGRKCLEPEKERPGFCPLSTENLSCVISPGKPQCRRDDNCPKNWKCCLSDNRMQCARPFKEKPGQCPVSDTKCVSAAPKFPCNSDRDCHGGKKCCKLACGMVCSDPASNLL
ncbi:hypothetical protein XELAEV_18004589mg [Xenopus laevis]|uniref:WAP domain-containing protein n=2 Tax=Xenopus laevis TaxID=8355 RepID=A0A974BR36_XENLA|nr:hypothetical protein XELAEV_18004589mg [Xenopus laevis]